jgi:hypothetical protein
MNGHRSILAPLDQPPVEALPRNDYTSSFDLRLVVQNSYGLRCRRYRYRFNFAGRKKGNPETAKGLTDPLGLTITIARPKLKTTGHVEPDYVQNNVVR